MQTQKLVHFVFIIILLTFLPISVFGNNNEREKFVVVLDAGHGGHDPGNLGNGYKEKDIALNIVLEIGKELEKDPNIEVVYTRKKDVFVDLFVRGKIANEANADLFVSIHCNSHNSPAHGTETFVLGIHRNQTNFDVAKKENSVILLENDYEKNYGGFDPNSPEAVISILLGQEEYLDQSIMLASKIQDNFTNGLKRKNRGVKQAGFIVLHQTVMPSVLIETGFLTYKSEGAYLNSNKGQKDMANSIKDAILDYKKELDQNVVSNLYTDDLFEEENTTVAYDMNVTYKVQIAASSRKLALRPYNFKGLDNITKEEEGKLYRYFYGQTSDYNEIVELQKEAKQKGYTSCFIVAYKNGEKISLADISKTTAN
ncbi:N-acetylmuramoyl-L-alanine amidase [Yeosuana sp. MJ-SS3]|uniref:N-acetylmuramoyl-L-alanine amidase n=1 Tax=Gilvirhabdus luticola TaxID=3079858 RepID=A0ABU3U9C4_9FLAO|nr:N-acetylmuramoyl-L-alanine amidase [Yeosuana sp. MJ-SS3]MDU8887012.1 N-acetylmuramoyl-L-alanine amidase [Yeosuana sp. MJ-SS3]